MKILNLFFLCFISSQCLAELKTTKWGDFKVITERGQYGIIKQIYKKPNGGSPTNKECEEILLFHDEKWTMYKPMFGLWSEWESESGFIAKKIGGLVVYYPNSKEKLSQKISNTGITIRRKRNYDTEGIGKTINAAIKQFGTPKANMSSSDKTILIFNTPKGELTQEFNKQGICISSTLRK